jgi:cystathionine beta-lyase/cystathionine gamma-synthase
MGHARAWKIAAVRAAKPGWRRCAGGGVEVLKSDWLTTGPKIGEFEERFAAWIRARHAVSFSSGTGALHGVSFAAGLGPGDEAITTPMTFCATANCVSTGVLESGESK